MNELQNLIKLHEGERLDLYQDSKGIWTIGVGYNIQEKGIPQEISDMLLDKTLEEARQEAREFRWFSTLNEPRQAAIIDLIFNMGLPTFKTFSNTIRFLREGLYMSAAKELLRGSGPGGKSRYYHDVGIRAERISKMIETGEWPEEVTNG